MELAKVWYKDKDGEFRFTRFENVASRAEILALVSKEGCDTYFSKFPFFYREGRETVICLSDKREDCFEIPSPRPISKQDADRIIRGMKVAGARFTAIRRSICHDERCIEI